jgi:colanic acid biosynthesis glycosyl transferase WcaI
MPGVLSDAGLERELESASLAVVSQRADVVEFNLPSKLMNFMAYGIPVVASVPPDSEVARLVRSSGSGWVANSAEPEEFSDAVVRALRNPAECQRRGKAGASFAASHFTPAAVAEQFERVLVDAVTT